jgi:predicted transposase/invertase (TIGR01784 family)
MKARYLNPFTDFGFKKLFGEEASKPLLMDFLNALLPLKHPIISIQFRNAEQLGAGIDERKAIYDIYCQDSQGSYFIVEMQKAKQNFFKDRAVFYTTFPIREQAEKGNWNYQLKAVYCVGLLDFVFEEDKDNSDYLHEVQLKNSHNKVFYDKLTLYFIELPKFHKAESELASQLENWVYFLKHLEEFLEIPQRFQHTILEKAFDIAELAHLNEEERAAYETSLKYYRDMINVIDTAREEALAEGKAEGKAEGELIALQKTAMQMIAKGFEIGLISELTGLSEDEIKKLK